MKMRMLLAGLAAGIVGFLVGWVLFGLILANYYGSHINNFDRLLRPQIEVNLIGIFLANLIFGVLVAVASWKFGITSLAKGFVTSAVTGFLLFACMDLFFLPMVSMFTGNGSMIGEILVNALWAGCLGGAAGLVLSIGHKPVYSNRHFYR